MSDSNAWGFVPAQSNPSYVSERSEHDRSKVQGGFAALFGEPALDYASADSEKPQVLKRSYRKKRG
jgi:hypothetical protein